MNETERRTPYRGIPPAALERPAPHGRRRCGGKTGPAGWSGSAGGREVESSGQGRASGSIIESVVETQLQAGYTVASSGDCFTSPFFLLAALLDPEKSRLAKKSERNANVTGLSAVSENRVKGCKSLGYEIATGSPENDFRYVGEQADPNSGFYYLRARWMDPASGRFFGVDPHPGLDTDPITLHRYLYAGASPLSFSDPSGEFFGFSDLSISSIIQGVGRVVGQTQMWTRYGLYMANRAASWALSNTIRIELYATAAALGTGIATDLVNSGADAILKNTTEYTGDVGGVVQEKMGANKTGYELIDDYRNGQATSIKSSRRTFDRVLGQIRDEAESMGNRNSPFRGPKGSNVPPLPLTSVRGLVMVIPEANGHWLRHPTFINTVRTIAAETKVVINVLPMRNWRPR